MGRIFLGSGQLISGSVLLNGTGGSAPARVENSPFVMENLFTRERRIPWQASLGTSGLFTLDIDTQVAGPINAWFMHNAFLTTQEVASVNVTFQTANSYPPASWTIRGNPNQALRHYASDGVRRDIGSSFPTATSDRYARFEFVWTALSNCRVHIGSINFGSFQVAVEAEGGGVDLRPNITKVVSHDQMPTLHYKGGVLGTLSVVCDLVTETELATLVNLLDYGRTISVIDDDDRAYECVVSSFKRKRLFSPDVVGQRLFTVTLELEVLP